MKHLFIVVLVALSFVSCNNSDDSTPEPYSFYGLAEGNSWTYRYYFREPYDSPNFESTDFIKVVEIIGTIEIDNKTYFEVQTTASGNDPAVTGSSFPENGVTTRYLREEDGNLIDDDGIIIYSNNIFEERFKEPLGGGSLHQLLTEGETSITTDAGTFNCIDNLLYYRNQDGVQTVGVSHNYYTAGIGQILGNSLLYLC